MSHEKCVKEMLESLTMAGVMTTIIFAFCHTIFESAGEVLAFYIGTQMILTYAVWSVIDWRERKRA